MSDESGDEIRVIYGASHRQGFDKTVIWQWSSYEWDTWWPQGPSPCCPIQNWCGLFKKSHLQLLPRPAFHTLRMDFSLWSGRPLWFSLLDSFLWLEVRPFLACWFQECMVCVPACYTGGFYFISLEWNGSHPEGLGACINRRTCKPVFNIQSINQPALRVTPSCFDERLLTAPQTRPWGPANHLKPQLYPRHQWDRSPCQEQFLSSH